MRYILRNKATGLYFTHPTGDENYEWSDLPGDARQWLDLQRCMDAALVSKELHGLELQICRFQVEPLGYCLSTVGVPSRTAKPPSEVLAPSAPPTRTGSLAGSTSH